MRSDIPLIRPQVKVKIKMSNQDKQNIFTEMKSGKFHFLLVELSAGFVRTPTDKIDREIEESLQRIAENMNLDSISLGLVTTDGQDLYSGYRYAKPGKKPWEASSLLSEGPFLTKTLFAGNNFIMEDVDMLPLEAAVDRVSFIKYDTRAAYIIPFIVGGQFCGGISFASSRPRQWPEHEAHGLRLIADVYANVLERKRSMQVLQGREEQIRIAAESANIGLWAWDIQQDTLWATDRARTIFGVMADEKLNLQRFLSCLHDQDTERVRASIAQASQVNGSFQLDYRIVHPDGNVHWINTSGTCQLNDEGLPVKMMGASRNFTESYHLKRDLECTNNDLKSALEENHKLNERFKQENIYLRQEISDRQHFKFVNGSAAMQQVSTQVQQVAPTPASVLIMGDTGTGKELLATAIHEASPRKNRPMIRVNCAAIPAALIESELFGREKGAYTGALSKQVGRFELADGSTLFLDEVGELPLESQAKLLRVLQEKQIERLGNPSSINVDVRVIAATNRDLSQEVLEGRFREDLYYRLNVFPIQVPPLSARREDIPNLVATFIHEFSRSMDKAIEGISKSSLQSLCSYAWPGNIRELRNVIERAVILSTSPVLNITLPTETITSETPENSALPSLAEIERGHILQVLQTTGWRVRGKGGAAVILGLNPSTLESRMNKHGIQRPSSV